MPIPVVLDPAGPGAVGAGVDGLAAEQVEDGLLAALEGKTDCLIAVIDYIAHVEVAKTVLNPVTERGLGVAIKMQPLNPMRYQFDAFGDMPRRWKILKRESRANMEQTVADDISQSVCIGNRLEIFPVASSGFSVFKTVENLNG